MTPKTRPAVFISDQLGSGDELDDDDLPVELFGILEQGDAMQRILGVQDDLWGDEDDGGEEDDDDLDVDDGEDDDDDEDADVDVDDENADDDSDDEPRFVRGTIAGNQVAVVGEDGEEPEEEEEEEQQRSGAAVQPAEASTSSSPDASGSTAAAAVARRPAPSAPGLGDRDAKRRKPNVADSDTDTDSDSSGEFDENAPDSEDDDEDDAEEEQGGGGSKTKDSDDSDDDVDDDSMDEAEADDEDDVVKAIIASTKTERSHPPDMAFEDFIVDISFHPQEDLLAVGTMGGDIVLTRYSNEENTTMATIENHLKAIRDLEFSEDGVTLYSTAKDKSIVLTDVETGKMRRVWENAHEVPVYRMTVIDENLFATGDEDGVIKLWDDREKGKTPIFSLKEVDDYITAMLTNSARKILLATSGDGYLTAINIGARKLYVQSEPYPEELTCMGLFRNESKLVVGSSKGRFYTYNWDEFGVHSNMFPGPKSPLSLMVPVTDRIAVTGGEEGIVRAMHMMPGRNLGVVGQHPLGVEAMDISNTGEFIASSSHENDIKFWNIKYFEDLPELKYNEKQNKRKEERHNLPSSKQGNAGDFFADLV